VSSSTLLRASIKWAASTEESADDSIGSRSIGGTPRLPLPRAAFNAARHDGLPALVYLHMLNRDDLLASRSQPLKGEKPLLKGRHDASGRAGEPCHLDVRPILLFTSHMDEVVDATVHLRRHFHGRSMCCRELVREHLFEAVPSADGFGGI
jgi:hypothetical protein